MGDTIEITTWPKHQNLFYLVTGSGLAFDVMAPANAAIGLARKPGSTCEYWIGIGEHNNRSWIKQDETHCRTVSTPDILMQEQYLRFWLQWNGGAIKLGRAGETKPLVSYTNKITELKYITFTALKEFNAVHWRFTLPPLRPKPQLKPITCGKLTWVPAGNRLPDGAVIGGFEYETLYVIRAAHRGSLTPGKFVPSEGIGYVSWGGDANAKTEFEVLCGFDCVWVPTSGDRIPVGAVPAGFSEQQQERLFIGRAEHEGLIIPGKVQASHKVCYIPYKGQEIAKKKFEILVEPDNARSVNKVFVNDIHIDTTSESDQDPWEVNDDEDYDAFNYDSNDDLNEVMAL